MLNLKVFEEKEKRKASVDEELAYQQAAIQDDGIADLGVLKELINREREAWMAIYRGKKCTSCILHRLRAESLVRKGL